MKNMWASSTPYVLLGNHDLVGNSQCGNCRCNPNRFINPFGKNAIWMLSCCKPYYQSFFLNLTTEIYYWVP